jgi:hypothetical protein
MRKLAISALAVTAVALGVVAWRTSSPDLRPALPNLERFSERSPQFRAVELKALAGSIEAANALMEYHSKCHIREGLSPDLTPERFNNCSSAVGYWTAVALENGSLSAAQRHTNLLLESDKCEDIYRADFWFRKFRPQFSTDPVFLKSVSDQISEKKATCIWGMRSSY